jgi:ABC-type branched-subunit amino acid transport system substrate-binding protein
LLSISANGYSEGNNTNISTQVLPSTIEVCALVPLTGGLSSIVTPMTHSINLAVWELNAQYSSYNWNLTWYDTGTDPAITTTKMTQAVNDNCVFVVGAAGSTQTFAAASIATANQVPLISYASTSPDLPSFNDHAIANDEGYLWAIPPSGGREATAMADIAKVRNYTSAVSVVRNDWLAMKNLLNLRFTSDPYYGQMLDEIEYNSSTYDPASVVTQIASSNPEVIFLISLQSDGSELLVEMLNQNLNIPVIGWEGIGMDSIYSESPQTPAAMQNVTSVVPGYQDTTASSVYRNKYDLILLKN